MGAAHHVSLAVRSVSPSSGYSVFAIGVADVDFVELQQIGSKPSERHVFVVDDFDAFDTIKENLITFICETATSSKTLNDPKKLRKPLRSQQLTVHLLFYSLPPDFPEWVHFTW